MKSILLFFLLIVIFTGGFAQDTHEAIFPKVRLGANIGFKLDNPELDVSDLYHVEMAELSTSIGNYTYINFFISNRLAKRWYIRTDMSFMNTAYNVNVKYTPGENSNKRWLFGTLDQGRLSFSWKGEFWLNRHLAFSTGPAINLLSTNQYSSHLESIGSTELDKSWITDRFFWGWHTNAGGAYPFQSFALQGNIGYLWSPQSASGIKFTNRKFSFTIGIVSEFE